MNGPRILSVPDRAAPGETYRLPAEKLIRGNPLQTVWNHYTSADGKFSTGIWRSEPGKWNIRYTEEEYCLLLEGRSVITDAAGNAITVGAGEGIVIPRGFTGTWEVLETTRKVYVIYEPGA